MPPLNDNFVSAQVISGASGQVDGDNTDATREVGEYEVNGDNTDPGATVWYAWTAPSSHRFTFDTYLTPPETWTSDEATPDTTLGVFTGAAVDTLTVVAENDDGDNSPTFNGKAFLSEVSFDASIGVTYFIQVGGYNAANFGPFTLRWALYVPPPPNDTWDTATVITGGSGSIALVNDFSRAAAPEFAEQTTWQDPYLEYAYPANRIHIDKSVWYMWTPTSGQGVEFLVDVPDDVTIVIYEGQAIYWETLLSAGPPPVYESHTASVATPTMLPVFAPIPGVTYHIQVGRREGSPVTTFTLSWKHRVGMSFADPFDMPDGDGSFPLPIVHHLWVRMPKHRGRAMLDMALKLGDWFPHKSDYYDFYDGLVGHVYQLHDFADPQDEAHLIDYGSDSWKPVSPAFPDEIEELEGWMQAIAQVGTRTYVYFELPTASISGGGINGGTILFRRRYTPWQGATEPLFRRNGKHSAVEPLPGVPRIEQAQIFFMDEVDEDWSIFVQRSLLVAWTEEEGPMFYAWGTRDKGALGQQGLDADAIYGQPTQGTKEAGSVLPWSVSNELYDWFRSYGAGAPLWPNTSQGLVAKQFKQPPRKEIPEFAPSRLGMQNPYGATQSDAGEMFISTTTGNIFNNIAFVPSQAERDTGVYAYAVWEFTPDGTFVAEYQRSTSEDGRWFHIQAVLPDGKFYVTLHYGWFPPLEPPQIWDPVTDTVTPTSMPFPDLLLPNGDIIAGFPRGYTDTYGFTVWSAPDYTQRRDVIVPFQPLANAWDPAGSWSEAVDYKGRHLWTVRWVPQSADGSGGGVDGWDFMSEFYRIPVYDPVFSAGVELLTGSETWKNDQGGTLSRTTTYQDGDNADSIVTVCSVPGNASFVLGPGAVPCNPGDFVYTTSAVAADIGDGWVDFTPVGSPRSNYEYTVDLIFYDASGTEVAGYGTGHIYGHTSPNAHQYIGVAGHFWIEFEINGIAPDNAASVGLRFFADAVTYPGQVPAFGDTFYLSNLHIKTINRNKRELVSGDDANFAGGPGHWHALGPIDIIDTPVPHDTNGRTASSVAPEGMEDTVVFEATVPLDSPLQKGGSIEAEAWVQVEAVPNVQFPIKDVSPPDKVTPLGSGFTLTRLGQAPMGGEKLIALVVYANTASLVQAYSYNGVSVVNWTLEASGNLDGSNKYAIYSHTAYTNENPLTLGFGFGGTAGYVQAMVLGARDVASFRIGSVTVDGATATAASMTATADEKALAVFVGGTIPGNGTWQGVLSGGPPTPSSEMEDHNLTGPFVSRFYAAFGASGPSAGATPVYTAAGVDIDTFASNPATASVAFQVLYVPVGSHDYDASLEVLLGTSESVSFGFAQFTSDGDWVKLRAYGTINYDDAAEAENITLSVMFNREPGNGFPSPGDRFLLSDISAEALDAVVATPEFTLEHPYPDNSAVTFNGDLDFGGPPGSRSEGAGHYGEIRYYYPEYAWPGWVWPDLKPILGPQTLNTMSRQPPA